MMLAASLILILESRIALRSTYIETEFLWKRGQHHIPPEARYMRSRMEHVRFVRSGGLTTAASSGNSGLISRRDFQETHIN